MDERLTDELTLTADPRSIRVARGFLASIARDLDLPNDTVSVERLQVARQVDRGDEEEALRAGEIEAHPREEERREPLRAALRALREDDVDREGGQERSGELHDGFEPQAHHGAGGVPAA